MTTHSGKGFKPVIRMLPLSGLIPCAANARTHSQAQVAQIAASIAEFGFTNPVLIDETGMIIAGHGRVLAARELGLDEVPTIELPHLSETQKRAYLLADNKIALNAGWDADLLAQELKALAGLDFELDLTGFSTAEIDLAIAVNGETVAEEGTADHVPALPATTVTRQGDIWLLGDHRLVCGDAQHEQPFQQLLGNDEADLVFTDPPYNVRVDGHVCGSGSIRHSEFAFASGEMDRTAFTQFLATTLGHAGRRMRRGSIAYICMDWRHMRELQDAGEATIGELKNLCVWNKTNGGMGSFYRSKHELIFVFRKPGGRHVNNFGLGGNGRYRTNVWDYPGISSLGANRAEELAMHPTVKPVALIADAIRDCSRHHDIVLDCFGGSGSTLIAAEQTRRRGFLIEYEPRYCDITILRWQKLTGKAAIHQASGRTFANCAEERLAARGKGEGQADAPGEAQANLAAQASLQGPDREI